jgi:hypothetical protein
MLLEIIGILIVVISLVLGVINTIRMSRIKKEQHTMSIMDLAEFQNLSDDVKAFYRSFILEKWIKAFNEKFNQSIEVNGLNRYYVENKEKLTKLNDLYLEIAKLGFKSESIITKNQNMLIYNADLDKLIKEAKSRKTELEAVKST